MLKPIIFWGASGHAKVLREFVGTLGYTLVATFDNQPSTPPPFPDVPLFYGREGFEQWHAAAGVSGLAGMIAIGGSRGKDRLELQRLFESRGIVVPPAIHPTAFVAGSASIGAGCHVLPQAAVCADAQLGEACIVNTRASVDHECVLGHGVHIAPGATLAGCVTVGDFSMIAVGATVCPRITIGRNVIIGAGSVVTRDVPDNAVVYGTPARHRRSNPAL